jgi:hypothetical protein
VQNSARHAYVEAAATPALHGVAAALSFDVRAAAAAPTHATLPPVHHILFI